MFADNRKMGKADIQIFIGINILPQEWGEQVRE